MKDKVAYYAGCSARYLDPAVGKATVLVLERNGFDVVFPEQRCCGMPHIWYGAFKDALKRAQFNVSSLLREDCDIITACTSCALMLKHQYPRLLGSQEAEEVAARTYDVSEYIILLHKSGAINTDLKPVSLSLVYHAPCHLKVRGEELIEQHLRSMKLIPGMTVSRMERGCCGMAGTFGGRKGSYRLSMQIGKALLEAISEASPDMVATDCPGCKMQIAQGTGLRVIHPVILLKMAYGL